MVFRPNMSAVLVKRAYVGRMLISIVDLWILIWWVIKKGPRSAGSRLPRAKRNMPNRNNEQRWPLCCGLH